MTEQEIIGFLQDNQQAHVIYLDLNRDVKVWIGSHRNENKLMILTEDGDFIDGGIKPSYQIIASDVFALPDDYEAKKEQKGEWVEFEIDKKGRFWIYNEERDDTDYFLWCNWHGFLDSSYDWDMDYTAFGGWQYEDNKRWYLAPAVKLKDGDLWNSYVIEEKEEAIPAIPVKIRFWREK